MAATANLANPATASLFLLAKSVSPSINPVINGTTAARAGATAPEIEIASRCMAARILPPAPARPDIRILYFSPTGRAFAIASFMPLNPSTPTCVKMVTARIASDPNTFPSTASLVCASTPWSAFSSTPITPAVSSNCLSAPRKLSNERPIRASASTASSVGTFSFCIIVLTLVPASLPTMPLLARTASDADKSSIDIFEVAATALA